MCRFSIEHEISPVSPTFSSKIIHVWSQFQEFLPQLIPNDAIIPLETKALNCPNTFMQNPRCEFSHLLAFEFMVLFPGEWLALLATKADNPARGAFLQTSISVLTDWIPASLRFWACMAMVTEIGKILSRNRWYHWVISRINGIFDWDCVASKEPFTFGYDRRYRNVLHCRTSNEDQAQSPFKWLWGKVV